MMRPSTPASATILLFALLLFAFAASGIASAQEGGRWTLRGGYSYTDFHEWGVDDPNGHALHVYADYSINEWLSAELGWLDGSRVSGDIFALPFTIRPDRRTLEPRALTIGPRVRWALGERFNLYATAGYAYTSHFYRLVGGTFATPDYTPGETRHDHELFYGAGIGFDIDERWGVNLDYRRLEFSDLPMDSVGVMAAYRFR